MSTDNTLDASQLVKSIQDVLKISEVRKAVVEGKPVTRPAQWRRRSNAPYYRERFALEVKAVFDLMMVDNTDRELKYKDTSLTRNSLYLKVNQGCRYLLDYMDQDGKYRSFYETIAITREKTGVRISFNLDAKAGIGTSLVASKVISRVDEMSIKEEMVKWLEEGEEGSVWLRDNLSLTGEEVRNLQMILGPLENIAATVTQDRIKLVKV